MAANPSTLHGRLREDPGLVPRPLPVSNVNVAHKKRVLSAAAHRIYYICIYVGGGRGRLPQTDQARLSIRDRDKGDDPSRHNTAVVTAEPLVSIKWTTMIEVPAKTVANRLEYSLSDKFRESKSTITR